jgi:type 1 glutamine amidotransferase
MRTLIFSLLALVAPVLISEAAEPARKPHVVFVSGDHEYSSEQTFPIVARELEKSYGMRATVLYSFPDENAERNIPGLELLETADLAVFYLRWRQLPKEQVARIEKYVQSGRPVIGFRTSTHAFNYPRGHELEKWNAIFGSEVLGAPPGWGNGHTHYGHHSETDVSIIAEAADHPILKGVEPQFHVRSWLYHVLPKYPPADATRLLMGKAVKLEGNRTAEDNPVAWTWKNKWGGRVFTTTLGHPYDFKVEPVQRLTVNAIHWALDLPTPDSWAGKMDMNNVSYHGIRPTR